MKNATERVEELWRKLVDEGCTEHEILDYIFGRMLSSEALTLLQDYADICGIEVDEDA